MSIVEPLVSLLFSSEPEKVLGVLGGLEQEAREAGATKYKRGKLSP
jgi:hypothetical protein